MPKNVTAGLEQHEIKLMGEASLSQSEDHAFLSNLFVLLLVIGLLLLPKGCFLFAQVEALNHKLPPVLLRCAKVVASENERWILNLEYFYLQLTPLRVTLKTSLIDFDVYFAVWEILFNVQNQLASDFTLVNASCKIFHFRVLDVLEWAYIPSSSLLEVVDNDISLLDPSLEVIEGDCEAELLWLGERHYIENQIH